MKKEKKTNLAIKILVGILAIFVIVGIVLTSYNTIKRIDNLNDYEKKTKEIIKVARKYAEDKQITKPLHITVNKLVVENYLKADNDKGEVIDTRYEDQTLNCNTVFIDFLYHEFDIIYNEEKDCSLMKAEYIDVELKALEINWDKDQDQRTFTTNQLIDTDVRLIYESNEKFDKETWYLDGQRLEVDDNGFLTIKYEENLNRTYSLILEKDDVTIKLKFIYRTREINEN